MLSRRAQKISNSKKEEGDAGGKCEAKYDDASNAERAAPGAS